MERKINGFVFGALVSVGIHVVIICVPISSIAPVFRVRELPGSIEVSLGIHQGILERTSAKSIAAKPPQQKIDSAGLESSPPPEAQAKAPGTEEGTSGRKNPDFSGDSALATPRYGGNPKPPYPEIARLKGYEGTVRLAVEVLVSGRVGGVWVKGSSGYEVLDFSALKTVKDWRFIPAQFAGVPVKSTVIVPVTFQLTNQLTAENQ
jgi:TonB family protein